MDLSVFLRFASINQTRNQTFLLSFLVDSVRKLDLGAKTVRMSYGAKKCTIKSELTTTSEQRPPVYNDYLFEVPNKPIISQMTSEQRPPVNNGYSFWLLYTGLNALTTAITTTAPAATFRTLDKVLYLLNLFSNFGSDLIF